ncbi:TRAP transporter small permease [Psychromonas sp. SA13A]|uniref:TRAP transporter small permease n=1 Tax=Psychromonas sp. SA13A TaxID=2686346 RepID=UPI001980AF3C|nr:TRAP transporter small permease [Psychromonas sp. SA13A]
MQAQTSISNKTFTGYIDKLSRLDEILAAVLLAVIVMLMGYGVITRYVFNAPSTWVEEICIALFIWMTFMGTSALMRYDEVVRIDYLVRKLPTQAANLMDGLLRPILVMFAIIFMIYWGFKLLPYSQVRFTPALKIPYIYIYAAVPVSAIFMAYHQIKQILSFFNPCIKEA